MEFNPLALKYTADEEGFTAFFNANVHTIYYFTLRMLGDPVQANAATHAIFLKAWDKFPALVDDANIRTALYRIAISHCQSQLHSWQQTPEAEPMHDAAWDATPKQADAPLEVRETEDIGLRIQTALDSLPEEYHLLLILLADPKLTHYEMAMLTRQTTDAIRARIARARHAFVEEFAKLA